MCSVNEMYCKQTNVLTFTKVIFKFFFYSNNLYNGKCHTKDSYIIPNINLVTKRDITIHKINSIVNN